MKKVIALLLAFTSLAIFAQEEDFTRLTLDKIFDDKLETKSFGPVQWLEDGSGFTILRNAEDGPRGNPSTTGQGMEKGNTPETGNRSSYGS
ncbi:MAG: hypothetical protein IMY68_08975 [Bacteroidetes bacterium]|nr:hypothetical protein [Bacteroidota bacterium]